MPEEKKGLSDKEVEQLSAIEFQSQSYSSFYNTTMEKDKSILTLSVAGMGFLLTLLQLAKNISYFEFIFFLIAALGYLVAIYSVISIFGKNSNFIIELVNKRDTSVKQYQLDILDKTAIRSFYLAIVMTVVLGVSTSQNMFTIGEKPMSDDKKVVQRVFVTDSCMKATDLHRSFQGASALQGSTQQQVVAQPQTTGAAAMMPSSSATQASSTSSDK
ncbi:hypothetical protein [Pseudoalteromonas sp. TAB23]|uniref:hypothetical protein n=1 Tax=Pseudoalteromonas sp. TAB23 TaxID=1938595 RepID=UPI00041A77EA|nr:hypothetical protein [Pseudoalteromonas sp. TAB23]